MRLEELTMTSGRRGEIVRLTQLLKVRGEFAAESLRLQQLGSDLSGATSRSRPRKKP